MIRLAILALALLLTGTARPARPRESPGVEQLRWMAGCWELQQGRRVTHEQWMAPLGGLMLGMSRTVVGDSVREYEQLRVESRDGQPTYVALPFRQAEASFPATSVSDTLVMFSNPAHDFPQRILYRRVRSDSLIARIEGTMGQRARGIDFPMRRVNCGG